MINAPAGQERKAYEMIEKLTSAMMGEGEYRECGVVRFDHESYDVAFLCETYYEAMIVGKACVVYCGHFHLAVFQV
jgi:hypothetical protein